MRHALASWLGLALLIAAGVFALGLDALRPEPDQLTGRASRVGRRWLWLGSAAVGAVMAAALVATAIRLSTAY